MKSREAWALAKAISKKKTVQAECRDGLWGVNADGHFFPSRHDLIQYLDAPLFEEMKVEIPQTELFTNSKKRS